MIKSKGIGRLAPATLALIAFASSSSAADLGPYGPPPAAPGYGPAAYTPLRWSGFYLGAQAGYGWGGTDATSRVLSTGATQSFSYDTGGFLGGLHAGYNWQAGNVVFGLETDIEATGMDGSGIGTAGGGHITEIDWLGSTRGRLGFAMANTLFYLTGGFAYGGVRVERSAGAGFTPFVGSTDWRTGWTLGGGVEHAFTNNISVRLEYRYTDLGNATFSNTANNVSDSSDATHSAVRAGLSFRF